MQPTKITRPRFPPGYVDRPTGEVSWEYVERQLIEARHYWLCTVRPDGRPHCVPRWGAWLDGRFYYDGSPQTLHARNLLQDPHVSLHLESGERAVILEGRSAPAGKPPPELAQRLAGAIGAKYRALGYAPAPDQWDEGGLYVFRPRQCIAWTVFTQDPTKFVFGDR